MQKSSSRCELREPPFASCQLDETNVVFFRSNGHPQGGRPADSQIPPRPHALRERISRGKIQPIPFLSRQFNLHSLCDFLQTDRIHRTDNRLDLRRMA